MSKENLPTQKPSEEVDLSQLFKLIGKTFDRFFRFIGSIFNKLFLAFVWFVFFTKKHFLKLVITLIVGGLIGLGVNKVETPIYKSTMVIRQNYNTGEHLFNTIEYYNKLIQQKDSMEIAKIFKINPNQASKINELTIESNLTENEKLVLFDEYVKGIDSVLAKTINYKEFTDNSKDYNYKIQKLMLKSTSKTNFNKVLVNIVENIGDSDYYKNERDKLIEDLYRRDSIINVSLKESVALQEVYKEVLKKPLNEIPPGASTNIAIGDTKEQNITKEYELYQSDLELRRELAENDLRRRNLEDIIEILSIQNGDGTIYNRARILGFETSWPISLAIKLTGFLYLILLLLEFVRFLERYKDKI